MDDDLPPPPADLRVQGDEVCGICSNMYRRPLLLPCLHSFCEPCLREKISPKLAQMVHCPTCDKSFTLEKGLESLPVNLILLRSSGEAEVVCAAHPKLDSSDAMYCKTCIEKVCPMFACLNKPHGTHDVLPLAEYVTSADGERQRVRNAAGHVDTTLTEALRQATEAVAEKLAQLRVRAEQVRASLRAAAAKRVAEIDSALRNELRRVDEYQAASSALCDSRLRDLTGERASSEHAMAFGRDLAANGSAEEVVSLARPVVLALEALRDRPTVCKAPAMGRISYEELDEGAAATEQTIRNLLGDLSIVHVGGRFSTSNIPRAKDSKIVAESGQTATMTVTSKLSNGKKSANGGDQLTAHWDSIPEEGAVRPAVQIDDNKDGTYKLTYTLPSNGSYKLRVALNGDEIGDSPFEFVASKDGDWSLDPEQCSKGVMLKDDGRTVLKNALGHSSALGRVGWSDGVRTWRLQVSQKQNCYAGVALQVPDAMTWKGSSRSNVVVWCFSTNGYKYSDVGVEAIALGADGSLVDITLDCEQHTLTMTNIDSGKQEVISGLPADTQFYPWFHLYYLKTSFNLLNKDAVSDVAATAAVVEAL